MNGRFRKLLIVSCASNAALDSLENCEMVELRHLPPNVSSYHSELSRSSNAYIKLMMTIVRANHADLPIKDFKLVAYGKTTVATFEFYYEVSRLSKRKTSN